MSVEQIKSYITTSTNQLAKFECLVGQKSFKKAFEGHQGITSCLLSMPILSAAQIESFTTRAWSERRLLNVPTTWSSGKEREKDLIFEGEIRGKNRINMLIILHIMKLKILHIII